MEIPFKRAGRSRGLLPLLCLALAMPGFGQRRGGIPTSLSGSPVVTLQGTVRMGGGERQTTPAIAQLKTAEGEVTAEEPVNAMGDFFFEDLRKQSYYLTVTAGGYVPYVQLLDLTHVGDSYSVNITLVILDPAEQTLTSTASRTEVTAPRKARKEWEQGVRALGLKKLEGAHAHLQKAVEIYPCYARAQTDLALTLMRQRDAPLAEAPLKKSIECDPDYTEAYLHLGRLLNALNRYPESRSVLAEGVRRAPSSWRLYYNLAQADEGLNNFPLAEQEFLRAQSFGPTAPVVHEKLANLYLKEKVFTKAYAEMKAYLAADPNGKYAEKIKAVMQQLESQGLVHPRQSQTGPTPPPAL